MAYYSNGYLLQQLVIKNQIICPTYGPNLKMFVLNEFLHQYGGDECLLFQLVPIGSLDAASVFPPRKFFFFVSYISWINWLAVEEY